MRRIDRLQISFLHLQPKLKVKAMNIGEFARRGGVSASAVRFYEDRGVLLPPSRLSSGYRIFGPADLERLIQVRRAQALGFSLEQIALFFTLPESERRDKAAIVEAAKIKLKELDLHLAQVKTQRRAITDFLAKHI